MFFWCTSASFSCVTRFWRLGVGVGTIAVNDDWCVCGSRLTSFFCACLQDHTGVVTPEQVYALASVYFLVYSLLPPSSTCTIAGRSQMSTFAHSSSCLGKYRMDCSSIGNFSAIDMALVLHVLLLLWCASLDEGPAPVATLSVSVVAAGFNFVSWFDGPQSLPPNPFGHPPIASIKTNFVIWNTKRHCSGSSQWIPGG